HWLLSAGLLSFSVLVHFTSAMVVAPASLLAYVVAARGAVRRAPAIAPEGGPATWAEDPVPAGPRSWSGHLAVFLIPVVVLAVNAFWWLPGVWLASTKGASGFAFSHS